MEDTPGIDFMQDSECSCQCIDPSQPESTKCVPLETPAACCSDASDYIASHVDLVEEKHTGPEESCSAAYNVAPASFSISSDCEQFDGQYCKDPETNYDYIFHGVQFPCNDCIDNITVHHAVQLMTDESITIKVWKPYLHGSSNATVLKLRKSMNVSLLQSNDADDYGGERYKVIGYLNGSFCFEPRDIFSVFIPSSLTDIDIIYIKTTLLIALPMAESYRNVHRYRNCSSSTVH